MVICPTTDQYKNYILTMMTAADPCAPSDLATRIGLFWKLANVQSMCDPHLQYLIATREVVKYLMGCKVWEVDTRQSRSQSDMTSTTERRQDGWSQAQSTGQSTSFRDAIGQSRYNDFSDAAMDAQSSRNAQAQSHDESSACMQDIGHGETLDESEGERLSNLERYTGSQSRTRNLDQGEGSRGNCNYQFNADGTKGQSYGTGLWQGGGTGNRNTWTAYSSDFTKNTEKIRNASFRETQSDSSQQTTSKMERQSSSYFNSHIDDGSSSSTAAHSEDHASGTRDSKSHAEGLGQAANETKAQGQNSAQGTSRSHSDGEEHRERDSSGFAVMDSQKLHQRFEHLKTLYDQYTEHIEHHKRVLMSGMSGKSGVIKYSGCLAGLPDPCCYAKTCC